MQDQAKALYLSHGVLTQAQREEQPELVPEEIPVEELRRIAAEIRAGQRHAFESSRLNRLLAQHAAVGQVTPVHIYGALLRFFAPALLFIGALYLVLLILRSLK
jgi:hypothetical protein